MKGVVLGGGHASRLMPLTKSLTKHCLPVYDKPMIHYPIESLVNSGITDIMLVTNPKFMQQYIDLLGDGSDLGCNIIYGCQMKSGGIAEAILVAESFVGKSDICVILGDNIFEQDLTGFKRSFFIDSGKWEYSFCHVVCKPVDEPQHYGVLVDDGEIIIEEKPEKPRSNLCVTGLYYYTSDVFNMISMLEPSERGELEVSDLNNMYAMNGKLSYSITTKGWWDTGVSIDHLMEVSNEIKKMKES